MDDKYYISFLYKKTNDCGYGSLTYSNTNKELTMEELEKIVAKEMKVDSIVILNILPFQIRGVKIYERRNNKKSCRISKLEREKLEKIEPLAIGLMQTDYQHIRQVGGRILQIIRGEE